ncbi:MAG: T9SS type A sorting domain-containing protein [Bacteroidia bacterium]
MKFYYVTIILFMVFLSVSAQPNGGFENWEMEYGNESPVGWQTPNFLCAFPFNTVSATKVGGIDKHSGNYALKLKSVHLITNPAPSFLDDTIGVAFTGTINLAPLYLKHGYSYTARPEMLNVWYKYLPVGNDKGTAGALLTRWNGVKRDTIAKADSILLYNPTYSLMQLHFNYFSDEFPDSAVVLFASSRYDDFARVNSTLFIDDIEFTGWVSVDDNRQKHMVSLYPNPAIEEVNFKIETKGDIKINIFYPMGKQIAELNFVDNRLSLDTKTYASGVYFYEVINEKMVLLTRGKFAVAK